MHFRCDDPLRVVQSVYFQPDDNFRKPLPFLFSLSGNERSVEMHAKSLNEVKAMPIPSGIYLFHASTGKLSCVFLEPIDIKIQLKSDNKLAGGIFIVVHVEVK